MLNIFANNNNIPVTNELRFLIGIIFIFLSLVLFLIKKKMFDSAEKSGSKIFKKENRTIHESRAWMIIIVFFILGILAFLTIK